MKEIELGGRGDLDSPMPANRFDVAENAFIS